MHGLLEGIKQQKAKQMSQSSGFVGPYISRNCSESMNKNMFEK